MRYGARKPLAPGRPITARSLNQLGKGTEGLTRFGVSPPFSGDRGVGGTLFRDTREPKVYGRLTAVDGAGIGYTYKQVYRESGGWQNKPGGETGIAYEANLATGLPVGETTGAVVELHQGFGNQDRRFVYRRVGGALSPCGGCYNATNATIAVTYWGFLGIAYGYGSGCGLVTVTGTMIYGSGAPLCGGLVSWGISAASTVVRIIPAYGLNDNSIVDTKFQNHYFCMYCEGGQIILFHRMQNGGIGGGDAAAIRRIDTWTYGSIDSCDPWVVTFDDPPFEVKYYARAGIGFPMLETPPYEVCYCTVPGDGTCGAFGIYGFPDTFANPFAIHSVVITGP